MFHIKFYSQTYIIVKIKLMLHNNKKKYFCWSYNLFSNIRSLNLFRYILFQHENCSIEMLKYIIEKYNLEQEFRKYGLNKEYHVELICEFICGEGQLLEKNHFLYQVNLFTF